MLSQNDLDGLPVRAQVALAARCARLIQPWFPPLVTADYDQSVSNLDFAIHTAEKFAAGLLPVSAAFDSAKAAAYAALASAQAGVDDNTGHVWQHSYWCSNTAKQAAQSAETRRPSPIDRPRTDVSKYVVRAASEAIRVKSLFTADVRGALGALTTSVREHGQGDAAFPTSIFAERSNFDLSEPTHEHRIVTVASFATSALIDRFARNPSDLRCLEPRRFEELMAELFDEFGYEVELTRKTRDGGRDIIAVRHHIVHSKYLIECKRYSEPMKVGVGVVRSLHGVVIDEKATKGIIATTTWFTRNAREYIERNKWQLDGADFDVISEWLLRYQRSQLARGRTRTAPLITDEP